MPESTSLSPLMSLLRNYFPLTGFGVIGSQAWVISSDADANTLAFAQILSDAGYKVYICDGTADEVQINAAITALPATGGEISLSSGNFYLAGRVHTGIKNYVILRGAGWRATSLILGSGVDDNLIYAGDGATYTTGLTITGMLLNGDSTNQSAGNGIHIHSVEDVHILNCYIVDCKQRGLFIEGTGARNTAYVDIRGNYIHDCLQHGVYFLNQAYGGIIKGNYIAGNGKGATYAGLCFESNSEHTIVGNLLDENGIGIRCYNASSFPITGNSIYNTERQAILADGGSHSMVIASNEIHSPSNGSADTYSGITTDGDYNVIATNVIYGIANRILAGVEELAGADYNQIANNVIRNSLSGKIIVGANTVDDNNIVA